MAKRKTDNIEMSAENMASDVFGSLAIEKRAVKQRQMAKVDAQKPSPA